MLVGLPRIFWSSSVTPAVDDGVVAVSPPAAGPVLLLSLAHAARIPPAASVPPATADRLMKRRRVIAAVRSARVCSLSWPIWSLSSGMGDTPTASIPLDLRLAPLMLWRETPSGCAAGVLAFLLVGATTGGSASPQIRMRGRGPRGARARPGGAPRRLPRRASGR